METASLRPETHRMSFDIMAGTGTGSAEEKGNVGKDEEIIEERIGLEEDRDILRKIGDPSLPSSEEIKEHCLRGHIPYRNWCSICVRAHGRDRAHRVDKGGGEKPP